MWVACFSRTQKKVINLHGVIAEKTIIWVIPTPRAWKYVYIFVIIFLIEEYFRFAHAWTWLLLGSITSTLKWKFQNVELFWNASFLCRAGPHLGAVVMRRLTGVDKNTNPFLPWNVFEFVNMPYLGILNREGIRTNMRRWHVIAAKCVVDSADCYLHVHSCS